MVDIADYEMLCVECDLHDKCHKKDIDWDKVDKCIKDWRKEVYGVEPDEEKTKKEAFIFR